jgi:hypothetical protein
MYEWQYVHIYTHIVMFLCVNRPLASIFASLSPPCITCSYIYLLGDPFSFACGANTHPLLSLVSHQMFSPCYFTHPKGTPQIKLHIYDINNISCPVWYNSHYMCRHTPLCPRWPQAEAMVSLDILHFSFMHRHHGIFLQTYSSQQILNYKEIYHTIFSSLRVTWPVDCHFTRQKGSERFLFVLWSQKLSSESFSGL